MSSDHQLTVHGQQENSPVKRQQTARYHAHRVKYNLGMRVSKLACTIFLFFLFFIATVTFIFWLSLRPHRPRYHMENFSLPSLGQENGFENARINYNVTVRNANQNIGVFYDSMQVTVYYEDVSLVTSPLLFSFYQEPKNTTLVVGHLSGAKLTATSPRWQEFSTDRAQGRVEFRFELTSTIRFKIYTWVRIGKHRRVHANCRVAVGPDGLILPDSKDKRCPVYFS